MQYDWLSDEHLVGAKRLLLVLKQFEEKMNCKPHSSRFLSYARLVTISLKGVSLWGRLPDAPAAPRNPPPGSLGGRGLRSRKHRAHRTTLLSPQL